MHGILLRGMSLFSPSQRSLFVLGSWEQVGEKADLFSEKWSGVFGRHSYQRNAKDRVPCDFRGNAWAWGKMSLRKEMMQEDWPPCSWDLILVLLWIQGSTRLTQPDSHCPPSLHSSSSLTALCNKAGNMLKLFFIMQLTWNFPFH